MPTGPSPYLNEMPWPHHSQPATEPVLDVLPASIERRLAEANRKAPPPPPSKEYEGSLKSVSERKGYGFIACEEVHRLYGRDVYLPCDVMPEGVKVLDRLRFTIVLGEKGHPQ